MGLLSGAGKDAVTEAGKVINQAIPEAEAAAKDVADHGVYGLLGLVTDIANRLNGAELPVDITITVRVTGKIGALQLTPMEYDVK